MRNLKTSNLFLLLVVVQALHSIEEYIGKLWAVFPPANYVCGLVSDDLHFGFLVINIGLFIFGLLSWYFLVRSNHVLAKFVIVFWLLIEIMNGLGHPLWSIMQKEYTPGVVTAPILFLTSVLLIRSIYGDRVRSLES